MSTFDLRWCRVRQRDRVLEIAWMWLRRTVEHTRIRQDRARRRRHFSGLNDHMLRDIGLTRADMMAESSKPLRRT